MPYCTKQAVRCGMMISSASPFKTWVCTLYVHQLLVPKELGLRLPHESSGRVAASAQHAGCPASCCSSGVWLCSPGNAVVAADVVAKKKHQPWVMSWHHTALNLWLFGLPSAILLQILPFKNGFLLFKTCCSCPKKAILKHDKWHGLLDRQHWFSWYGMIAICSTIQAAKKRC